MSNIKTITREPDPTTKIITLDMDADELADANGKAYNVELIVDGLELRGIHFTVNNGAESLAYSSVFGDGVLTRGTHGAVWGHKDDVGSGHYCTDLNLWIAAP